MRHGFLLSADVNYAALVEVAVCSLLKFSRMEIRLVTYGWKTGITDSMLNAVVMPTPPAGVKKCWGARILECDFDLTCMLDADTVAAPNIDNIFSYWADRPFASYMMHPHAFEVDKFEQQMRGLGAPPHPKIPYVHGAPCIASKTQEGFISEFQRLLESPPRFIDGPHKGGVAADEHLTNYALRCAGADYCMPYGVVSVNAAIDIRHRTPWTCGYHGQKDPEVAAWMLKELSND